MKTTNYFLAVILLLFLLPSLSQAATPLQQLRINRDAPILNSEFSTSFHAPQSESITVVIPNTEDFQTSAIRLIGPDNVLITENNASLYGINFVEFEPVTSEEYYIALTKSWLIEITDAKAGQYVLEGTAISSYPQIPVKININDSKILFSLSVGTPSFSPSVNKFLPISIFLAENGIPYTQGHVSFEVSNDEVPLQQVTILDNGVYPDYLANDGLYSMLFKPLEVGIYDLSVHVTGVNLNGDFFESQITSRFKSHGENIYLTNNYFEELSDADGDGYIDEWVLNFETGGRFPETGRYKVHLNLGVGDEENLIHIQGVDASENRIYAKIDGEKIRSLNYTGEFRIKSLAIFYDDQLIQETTSLANTQSYDNDSWERDDLLLLGNVTFDSIDSADARFIDMIDASFEVDALPAAANFGYSVTITTESGEHVGVYGSSSIELIKGTNKITFSIPAADFSKLQSNTALKINQLLMYPLIKGGNVISKSNVATSLVYSCWDFRGCSTADNAIPVAVDDAVTSIGKAMYIHAAQNDLDDDGDLLKVNSVTPAQHGVAEIVGNSIQYTPSSGFEGDDVFQYEIVDIHPKNNILKGGSAIGTVRVSVNPNHAPIANEDSYHIPENMTSYFKVLDNDTDSDGDGLYISSFTQPSHGTLVNYGNQLGYTPNPGYLGNDSFSYTIIDYDVATNTTKGGTATSQVTVQIGNVVNNPPVAVNDVYSLSPGSQSVLNVLANDTDPDQDDLRISGYSLPGKGSLVVTDKLITYTADLNASGTDTFAYSISDGRGGSSTAIVNINFVLANNPAVAVDDVFETTPNTTLVIDVLRNDYDLEGDSFNVIRFTQPYNGTVTRGIANELVYSPDVDFVGDEIFSYTIQDAQGNLSTALVHVSVKSIDPKVVALDDTVSVAANTSIEIDVLSNDSASSSQALTISDYTQPAHGAVSLANNKLTYTPQAGFFGDDTFTYHVTDKLDNTASASVYVTVNKGNTAPVAMDDVAFTQANVAVSIDVLSNDTDADNDPIQLIDFSQGTHGGTLLSGSNIIYQPESGYVGQDSFTYLIADPSGDRSQGTVLVNIVDGNRAPSAEDDAIRVYQGASIKYDVLSNDSDPDGDLLVIESVTQAANGFTEIEDNKVKYTAPANFVGTTQFTYVITDGQSRATATVLVTVEPNPNTAPVVEIHAPVDGQEFSFGSSIQLNATAWDIEDGDLGNFVTWTSNIDGELGEGKLVDVILSLGQHTIVATIVDSRQEVSSDSVTIIIVQAAGQVFTNVSQFEIPDNKGYGVSSSITVPSDIYPSGITVSAKISHPNLADIAIQLISPSGRHYNLANPGSYVLNETWTIDSNMIETVKGVWTLKVSDQKKDNLGTLTQWSIQFD
jgi:hypothetical protein